MKKVTQLILVAFIAILFANCSDSAAKENTADANEVTAVKSLVRIDSLEGNGMKQSKNFHLSGGEVSLVYAYKSDNDMVGTFACYVIDKGHDFNKEGGIPDVMTSNLNEKSSSALTKDEGDYYLKVNAAGNFKVVVMEWK